ncbi:maleylpyruvate isomerase family mycothiol-dependent enzyme [Streptomyces marispadix]|uniref:Maleylpyruvate isomerase family mycothiol-dependent enzyme n=1 Tax=Streptomyces marispadix TaxID=2922868 RepID=A0ABS9SWN3_9ACTN|nr:maleylpyruvate isomerase family mycothiol-dependent enzyme [Streptomyces marispadix]MCH6160660.1 maleylpyruvate isomerase family mycothiol-dependent enzyme [Streptomyces marispadix]
MDDGTPETGTALLERALGYALCAVRPVTAPTLDRPTPCGSWDLGALLWHACDSLAALYEGFEDGYVAPAEREPRPEPEPVRDMGREPVPGTEPESQHSLGRGRTVRDDDPAAVFRARASRLLGAWTAAEGGGRLVAIGDLPLTAAALAGAGALEIAVHGWDVAQATGLPRPVPASLATVLMRTARQLVPRPSARHPLFGPPLTVPAEADPSDRLVAFLGRDPYWAWRNRAPGCGSSGRPR